MASLSIRHFKVVTLRPCDGVGKAAPAGKSVHF
jgi:hypothetical protein